MTETDVDPNEGRIVDIEAQAESGAGLQIRELEQGTPRHDLARVEEQSAVQSGENLPLVLGVVDDLVAVAEAKRPESAQVVGAAENRLQIERRRLGAVGLGERAL